MGQSISTRTPRFSALHIAALLIGFLTATAPGISSAEPNQPSHSDEIIHIGVALPLTGDLTEYGVAVQNGMKLAQAKFPERFKHLQLAFEDNKYDTAEALTIFQKFRSAGVDLVYSWGEVPLNAIASVAERSKIPVLAMSLDIAPALKKRYVIRTLNNVHYDRMTAV